MGWAALKQPWPCGFFPVFEDLLSAGREVTASTGQEEVRRGTFQARGAEEQPGCPATGCHRRTLPPSPAAAAHLPWGLRQAAALDQVPHCRGTLQGVLAGRRAQKEPDQLCTPTASPAARWRSQLPANPSWVLVSGFVSGLSCTHLSLPRCVCRPGYEGNGVVCSEKDPCANPSRGGCSQNVSAFVSRLPGTSWTSRGKGFPKLVCDHSAHP